MRSPRMQRLLPAVLLALGAASLDAQTIDDGLMMPRKQLCTGFVYMHDSWDRYWEGPLERGNGNIGTLTTQSVSWMGTYGITDRLNVIAMVPWVTTGASAGTSSGLDGVQDLTAAVKWEALDTAFTKVGAMQVFLVASGSVPLTDYTPDFMPMSIGSHSNRFAGRMTINFQAEQGWFVEGTGAYTWRDTVTLDRPAYFTDDRLFLSDQVAMPDVIDYTFRAGYWKHGLYAPVSFTQVITLGGSDIRRQDMPFVSNRMNSSRLDALAMYYLKKPGNFVVRLGASYTISGRNVGESTTLVAGLLYTFKF
jgi:hypothetical protein